MAVPYPAESEPQADEKPIDFGLENIQHTTQHEQNSMASGISSVAEIVDPSSPPTVANAASAPIRTQIVTVSKSEDSGIQEVEMPKPLGSN